MFLQLLNSANCPISLPSFERRFPGRKLDVATCWTLRNVGSWSFVHDPPAFQRCLDPVGKTNFNCITIFAWRVTAKNEQRERMLRQRIDYF